VSAVGIHHRIVDLEMASNANKDVLVSSPALSKAFEALSTLCKDNFRHFLEMLAIPQTLIPEIE
jgi:hypothetical protein